MARPYHDALVPWTRATPSFRSTAYELDLMYPDQPPIRGLALVRAHDASVAMRNELRRIVEEHHDSSTL